MTAMNEEQLLQEMGRRLFAARKQLRLTQKEVAARARIDRTYYSNVETGKNNITFRSLCRIAAALEHDVAFFMNDMPTPVYGGKGGYQAGDVAAAEE